MKAKLFFMFAAVSILAATIVTVPTAQTDAPMNAILARALDIELGNVQPRPHEQLVSSGVMYALLAASGELERRAGVARSAPGQSNPPASATGGCPNRYTGGGTSGGVNVRVNQDCSLRRQAEEVLAVNPTNPNNLIVGQNDARIGFNHCGYAWSFDGGRTWGDQVPPFYQFQLAGGHTADACSDPTATFDSAGNAYVGGILFDVAFPASAFVVAKSNAPLGGSFYHTPQAGTFQTSLDVPLGVIANDNNPNIFHDKEFIVADAGSASPKKDNVYAAWTRFTATNSPIYFSQSTNGGESWSPGIAISGASSATCTTGNGSANPDACDQDQGPHPIVGPDGTIYVAFANSNTPLLGVSQVLFVSCPGTANCASAANWTAPTKVGDLIGVHPIGPSPAGCPAGRRCLPPNGYRVPEVTSVSASVDKNGKLYVAWADARNLGPSCNPNGPAATATPPCDNDVFYAYSTDGGATWSATMKITPAYSAQWQPWSAVTANGKLWVAYYDRSYGTCEYDGCNDITLAGIDNPASATPNIRYTRVTTSSMPNLTPTNNPIEAGFLGDYMWVAVDAKGKAYVTWADTRGRNGTVEEDVYFATSP